MSKSALDVLPRVLPLGWSEVVCPVRGARAFVFELGDRRSAIVSVAQDENDREWLHLSLAGRLRLPSWEALIEARALFLGDRAVVQFLPRAADWVNIHEHTLHLWAPLDGVWPTNFLVGGERRLMAYGEKVKQPSLPFAPEGDVRRDMVESSKLQRRIDLLFSAIGKRARCAGCHQPIIWVVHRNGKKAPYDADATNHFGTCPKREQFRRGGSTDG